MSAEDRALGFVRTVAKPKDKRKADRPAGIREMAETLGVSIGTVDRALHEGLPVREAVAGLLRREPRPESH